MLRPALGTSAILKAFASRRYQPDAEEPAEIDYIMMPVSELPVSAGLGAFLEGEMFQQIQVPASNVPAGA